MGNCKFANISQTEYYIFEKNPKLPFDKNIKILGKKEYRLINQTLKIYKGVEKYFITLEFENIENEQVEKILDYYLKQENFLFFEDSDQTDFLVVNFEGEPHFTKDINDKTYSGSIKLQEV